MKPKSLLNNPPIEDYLKQISGRESTHTRALRKKIAELNVAPMSVDEISGQCLHFLAKLINAKHIIEIGTYYGYSTLWLAEALPEDGKLITCDINEQTVAREAWKQAGVADKIESIIGPAIQTLDKLIKEHSNTIDFIFIDADKASYDAYYEKSLELIRPGGLVVLDNVIAFGSSYVFESTARNKLAVDTLNKKLKSDERIDLLTLGIGDGMTLVRKV
jgi:predicted O-methyltransferase YrrM